MIKVWDLGVRVFHWSLVATFAVAWLSSEDADVVHAWSGYVAAGLIALRLVWGLVGPRYARFSQFITGPSAAVSYLKASLVGHEPRYVGHNPAGAAMIVALLITMSATVFTGWLTLDPARVAMLPALPAIVGPAFAEDGEEEGGDDSVVSEIHGALANLMLLLVVLHVAGVVLASRRHQENLAAAMVSGVKRAPAVGDVA
ncbi:MAG: cytochrome b/b6 domain-containing protein [Pseudorhodobacter sp.]|nr:cytochrome b/b6 domain-containing protein [Pseudorhodobacter sp.]